MPIQIDALDEAELAEFEHNKVCRCQLICTGTANESFISEKEAETPTTLKALRRNSEDTPRRQTARDKAR